jgi:succinate dehydrogenase / fumarate reductase cytochrome b subunit
MSADFNLFGLPIVAKGQHVHDVYSMVYLGFANPVVSLFYIVAVALLSLHLMHGVDSMFQTFGVRNHRWATGLRRAATLFSLAYLAGNVAIPGAILAGLAKPAAGTTAAKKIAAAAVVTPSVVQR